MKIQLIDGENLIDYYKFNEKKLSISDKEINEKYTNGEVRIVTEQGAYKLSLLKSVFQNGNYILTPDFQRRLTWDNKKKSRLIESFIINIPVPPVFIYEYEFDKYEVMDGLQRISTIISFYNNEFALEGLEEWTELNGRKYYELPEKVKEGIDRRQLSAITLLKESSKNNSQADSMKKMVFERLNSGGVKLNDQEIRNALYDGAFHEACSELSNNSDFKLLWNIPHEIIDGQYEDENATEITKNKLFKRMYDVELVLRFFAMRHLESFTGSLSKLLDNCLRSGNTYSIETIRKLSEKFTKTISLANEIFGEIAFCQYRKIRNKKQWSDPQRKIYDPLMLALTEYINNDKIEFKLQIEERINLLRNFYEQNYNDFDGKRQSKTEIEKRYNLFKQLLSEIIK